jgi:5-methylcytosine-specific restriction endonuclease McrA
MLVPDRMNERELLQDARQLRDEELLAGLDRLLRDDRALTVQLIVHIGEVDARGLYREQAYASMFEYAVEALHMSESEAYTRIRAARRCREFPVVLGMLARGELHLSAVKLLAPVLTADNCDELLRAARFKSKRQVELVLAQRFPKPDVQSVIRKLPAKPSSAMLTAAISGALQPASDVLPENSNSTSGPEPVSHCEPAPSLQLAPAAPEIAPLRAERYKVQFTANQQLRDKITQAQDLLRHQVPDGDLATVVERALDLLIAERMKRRFALVRRPRAKTKRKPSRPDSRHIPHEVRRDAIARDGLQCSYLSATGKRCEQRGLLELHHEQPYRRGGPATTSNIHVLCRAHNQLLAERDYGRAFVQKRVAEARAQRPAVRSSRESRDELPARRDAIQAGE